MPSPGQKSVGPGTVLRALGRLLLLVSLGFGAGLLIGVVSEEPELLAGHLRGESESVSLAGRTAAPAGEGASLDAEGAPESAPSATGMPVTGQSGVAQTRQQVLAQISAEPQKNLPAVAAAKKTRSGTASTDQSSRSTEAAPKASAPSKSQPSVASKARDWAIQVGAFSDEAAASRLARSLSTKGFPVELMPARGGAKRWRVRVQPITGEADARQTADRLKREERLPTWVIPMEARSEP